MLFLFGWAASLSATSFLAAAKMGPRRALALIHMLPSNFDLKLYREHMSCRCFTVGAITHPPVWQHAHGRVLEPIIDFSDDRYQKQKACFKISTASNPPDLH
eukprot:scaffold98105_cov16-Tisochrysis_lutea.AAC.1